MYLVVFARSVGLRSSSIVVVVVLRTSVKYQMDGYRSSPASSCHRDGASHLTRAEFSVLQHPAWEPEREIAEPGGSD